MWSSNRKRYCVFGCTVLGVYMHNFPHPERKSELFKKWVSVVGDKLKETDPWRIYKNKKICDHHFTTEQKVACHRLMNNAVPSVNLNGPFAVSSYTQIEHNYCLPGTYTSSFSQQSSAKVVMDEALHSRLNTHDQPSTSQAYVDKGEEERLHQCGECGLTLSTRSALTAHARSHRVTADAHRCDVCQKTFAVPARLVRHYRTHTGERPFECEYCHKMFSVKENLQVHRRIHTKERPYRCGVCGAAFEHSGKLHRHARIHTGERPHACPHCHKTFIQSGQLVIHLRTHTGEKPYRCPAPGCGKGFTCSKQLKVHSRTHTGERPYTCDICLRDFGYNHVLKLHRFQHYGERCYRCTVCDGTFNTKKQMEAHIYKEHGAETPRAPSSQPSPPPLPVDGNVMCDMVEAALQQLPPTPPSSPPSPQCPVVLVPAPTLSDSPVQTTSSPLPPSPPLTGLQFTLPHSSLPPRKRKLIPQPEETIPVVRHMSVIQFAPAAADVS